MTLIAQSIGSAWRRDQAEGEKRVNRLLELSQTALAEMRALLAELRPPDTAPGQAAPPMPAIPSLERVRKHGLAQALLKYGQDIARDGLHVDLDDQRYTRRPLDQEEAVFRIAQEALNNVVKHAQAQRVTIRLVTEPHITRLAIQDNGVGLDRVKPVSGRTGLGLSTMRERVQELGGMLNVVPTPGGGTTVEIVIPN
jgi:signal transduction histidine kinase